MEHRDRTIGATWAALLAPAVTVLPGLAARLGGAGGWIAPLAALPVFLLLLNLWRGLAGGAGIPRSLTIIYIMWAVLLGAARLRLSVRRMQTAEQWEADLWVLLPVVAAMALWLARGERATFLRAASVFGWVLTAVLAGVLGLALFQVRAVEVLPVWVEDVPAVGAATACVLGVLCYGVYGAFLWEGSPVRLTGRAACGCGVLTLLLLSVLGNLGAELAGGLEDPFLTLSKHVGVAGAFQRIESLISALWLLGDLALLGLLLQAGRRLVSGRSERWIVPAGAVVMALLAGTVFGDAVRARHFETMVVPWCNLVFGGVIPGVLNFRKRNRRISCGGTE